MATIFADLFFWARFPLRNLALFSACFALATPLFWFDLVGTENLLVAGALALIVVFHLRGSLTRYLAALVLVGLLPLLKMTAAMTGLAALLGFLVDRTIKRRWRALPDVALAVLVPTALATAVLLWSASSVPAFLN